LALLRATGVVLLAVGANWVSQQLFGSASFLTFAAVIAASALKFGLLQNIVTLLLAVLASDFFFIPPVFRLSMNQETLDVALEYSMVLIVSLGLLRRKSL
jgi:K+-sensing histidine kinase KdpD